ncbi:MAG: tRNA epoxyqueuosine(34) reductase QueG [Pseudomonadota bacterium]
MTTPEDLIQREAKALGFDAVGFTAAELPSSVLEHLREALSLGHHGTMAWMEDRVEHRAQPKVLWDGAISVVMLGMNYGPDQDPLEKLRDRSNANISVYAQGDDYHDVIKKKLKQLGRWIGDTYDVPLKVFVDTAPVAEKPLAGQAGLGWQGKHTNLVSRAFGSWLFLGAIYVGMELEGTGPDHDRCGSCTACLDACPTDAFPAPYKLDARRCISYLTIEHKGPIPDEFREAMGNRIYGCDDCLAACPWNKFAQEGREAKLHARDALRSPPLDELAALDDAAFRALFRKSPVKRIGRDRFVRNVAIAIGNSADAALYDCLIPLLDDDSTVVRDAAQWAEKRLAPFRHPGPDPGSIPKRNVLSEPPSPAAQNVSPRFFSLRAMGPGSSPG